jgi:hypothetical protein
VGSDFNPEEILGKKGLRLLDRSTRLLMSATELLIKKTNLRVENKNTFYTEENTALIAASMFGSIKSIFDFDKESLTDPQYVNPMVFPNTVTNAPAGYVCIRNGIRSFSLTLSHGFVAGLDAIGMAKEYLENGYAEMVYAGGVEEKCEHLDYGFKKGQELGILKNSEVGEGSAMFAIEKESAVKKRGATSIAEVFFYDSFRFNANTPAVLDNLIKERSIEGIIYYYPGTKLKMEDIFAGIDKTLLHDFYKDHIPAYSLDGGSALEWALTNADFVSKNHLLIVGINPNLQVSILGINKN